MSVDYKNYLAANVGTTPVAVYTATKQSTVIGLILANTTTSEVNATVTLTSGGTTVNIIKNVPLKVGNSLDVAKQSRIVAEIGDIVTVTAATASSVDVTLSTMEVA